VSRSLSPTLDALINALRCLPGVGPKTAQRMAFSLLEQQRAQGLQLADALQAAMTNIQHCQRCRNFSDTDLCHICQDKARDPKLLCIVESPLDVLAIEQTLIYKGYYFILLGHLSPLDGIGPERLGLLDLKKIAQEDPIEELILATNPTVEGEATAQYIADLFDPDDHLRITRLAHGIPMGGEIEYLDATTLGHALFARRGHSHNSEFSPHTT
jgi:recombination protein RecR